MKLKPHIFLAFCLVVCLPSFLLPSLLQAEIPEPKKANKRFVIAAHEWPPFSSRQARYFGILPRIASEILEAQGIAVDFRFVPWADGLDGLITEEYDGALIWVMTDLKSDSLLMSDPIMSYRSGLYYRKTFPKPESEDDLLGYRIGLNPYYVYDAPSYQLMKSRSMTPVLGDTDIINFQHLFSGDIDFFLTPILTSKPLLENNFTPEQQTELAFTTALFQFPPSRLVVNKHRDGSAELIEQFNRGLKRLKNNGSIDQYLNDLRFDKY